MSNRYVLLVAILDGDIVSNGDDMGKLDQEDLHVGCCFDLPLLPVCIQSTPSREFFSFTCRDLIEANVSIGLSPEFSARAIGTASSASAKARMAYCSRPGLYTKDVSSMVVVFCSQRLIVTYGSYLVP